MHSQIHPEFNSGTPSSFLYTYNLAGLLTQEIYPSGRTVSTTYDCLGRVNGLSGAIGSGNPTNYAGLAAGQAITYWADGGMFNIKLGNSLWEQWQHNALLQPININLGSPSAGSTSVRGLTLSYGTSQDNGNLLSQTITGSGLSASETQSYQYDRLNRITSLRRGRRLELGVWLRSIRERMGRKLS